MDHVPRASNSKEISRPIDGLAQEVVKDIAPMEVVPVVVAL